jgi:ABC-2 type transport system permease protein
VQAAEQYRRLIQRVMNNDIAEHAKPGTVYVAGPDLWNKVPPFAFEASGAGGVLAHYVWSVATLVVWLIASIWFALSSAGRAEVEA